MLPPSDLARLEPHPVGLLGLAPANLPCALLHAAYLRLLRRLRQADLYSRSGVFLEDERLCLAYFADRTTLLSGLANEYRGRRDVTLLLAARCCPHLNVLSLPASLHLHLVCSGL